MLLVDSHCHLDSLDYTHLHRDIDDVLAKAAARDVKFLLAVATSLSSYRNTRLLTKNRAGIVYSCGVHPLNLDEEWTPTALRQLAAQKEVVAIGETGLDYFYQPDAKAQQRRAFCEHIRAGRALNKPVIVHTRNARADTLAVLRDEQAEQCRGVLHCFTEDTAMAAKLLDMGFYISFSGIVTFRNAAALHDVVRYTPLDRLLIETDSPYLAPVPFRGKENQPARVREVAEFVATLKNIDITLLAQRTCKNFADLFRVTPVDPAGGQI